MEHIRSTSTTASFSPPSYRFKISTLHRSDSFSSATSPPPITEPPPHVFPFNDFMVSLPPEPPDPPDWSETFRSYQIRLSPCNLRELLNLSPTNPWYKPLNPHLVVYAFIFHTVRLILFVGELAAVGHGLAKRGGNTLTFGETLTERLSWFWAWTWPIKSSVKIGYINKSPLSKIQQRESGVCDVFFVLSWTPKEKRASSLVRPQRGYSQQGVKPPLTDLWRWPRSLPNALTNNREFPPRVSPHSHALVIDIGDEYLEGIVQEIVSLLVVLKFTSRSGRMNTIATIEVRLEECHPSIKCKTRNVVSLVARRNVLETWSLDSEEEIRTVSVKSESLQMVWVLALEPRVFKLHGSSHEPSYLSKRFEPICCMFFLAVYAVVTKTMF